MAINLEYLISEPYNIDPVIKKITFVDYDIVSFDKQSIIDVLEYNLRKGFRDKFVPKEVPLKCKQISEELLPIALIIAYLKLLKIYSEHRKIEFSNSTKYTNQAYVDFNYKSISHPSPIVQDFIKNPDCLKMYNKIDSLRKIITYQKYISILAHQESSVFLHLLKRIIIKSIIKYRGLKGLSIKTEID